jgi:hypothetical protein
MLEFMPVKPSPIRAASAPESAQFFSPTGGITGFDVLAQFVCSVSV